MKLNRREWCQCAGVAVATVAMPGAASARGLAPDAVARPWLLTGKNPLDPRGNLAGYVSAGAEAIEVNAAMRRARGCDPRRLRVIWPAETLLARGQWQWLHALAEQGASVIEESPLLGMTSESVHGAVSPLGSKSAGRLIHVFGKGATAPFVSPYLRVVFADGSHTYLRHDSEIAYFDVAPGRRVLRCCDTGRTVGVEFGVGRGRVLRLGARLGAPALRGDAAARRLIVA